MGGFSADSRDLTTLFFAWGTAIMVCSVFLAAVDHQSWCGWLYYIIIGLWCVQALMSALAKLNFQWREVFKGGGNPDDKCWEAGSAVNLISSGFQTLLFLIAIVGSLYHVTTGSRQVCGNFNLVPNLHDTKRNQLHMNGHWIFSELDPNQRELANSMGWQYSESCLATHVFDVPSHAQGLECNQWCHEYVPHASMMQMCAIAYNIPVFKACFKASVSVATRQWPRLPILAVYGLVSLAIGCARGWFATSEVVLPEWALRPQFKTANELVKLPLGLEMTRGLYWRFDLLSTLPTLFEGVLLLMSILTLLRNSQIYFTLGLIYLVFIGQIMHVDAWKFLPDPFFTYAQKEWLVSWKNGFPTYGLISAIAARSIRSLGSSAIFLYALLLPQPDTSGMLITAANFIYSLSGVLTNGKTVRQLDFLHNSESREGKYISSTQRQLDFDCRLQTMPSMPQSEKLVEMALNLGLNGGTVLFCFLVGNGAYAVPVTLLFLVLMVCSNDHIKPRCIVGVLVWLLMAFVCLTGKTTQGVPWRNETGYPHGGMKVCLFWLCLTLQVGAVSYVAFFRTADAREMQQVMLEESLLLE